MKGFDPYHKWLGIPPKEQPPNHYRLLGIDLFESDPDVIDATANQRMAYLQTLAAGEHSAESQKLLNEVSSAQVCLLDAAMKDNYDAELRQEKGDTQPTQEKPSKEPPRTEPSVEKREDADSDKPPKEPIRTDANSERLEEVQSPPKPSIRERIGSKWTSIRERIGSKWNEWNIDYSKVGKRIKAAMFILFVGGAFVFIVGIAGTIISREVSKSSTKQEQAVNVAEQSEQTAPKPEPIPKEITNSIGMKLVLIPAGEFLMGSPDSDEMADHDEKPQHEVKITKSFYMGIYEVTQGQYETVMDAGNPSSFRETNHPVNRVTWDDANEFCRKLSEKEEKTCRLPTEAEWEYACRAGSTSKWSFGDNVSDLWDHGWHGVNNSGPTHPVGLLQQNSFGLYDIHGNVSEWCLDFYENGFYGNSPLFNPTGPTKNYGTKICRGGDYSDEPKKLRSAYRGATSVLVRSDRVGFRAVYEVKEVSASSSRLSDLSVNEPAPLPKIETAGEVRSFYHIQPVGDISFSSDGRHAVSASGEVKLWDVLSGQQLWRYGELQNASRIAFGLDGSTITACSKVSVHTIDSKSGRKKTSFLIDADRYKYISKNGRYVAAVKNGGRPFEIFDVRSQQKVFSGKHTWYYSGAFTPNERFFLIGGLDIKILNISSQRFYRPRIEQSCTISVIDVSPDQRLIATGSGKFMKDGKNLPGDGSVRLWDFDSGRLIGTLNAYDDDLVHAVCFSPDGKRLLSGGGGHPPDDYEGKKYGADTSIRLWDVKSQKLIHRFEGHRATLKCLKFSPDGKYALSGSADKTMRLWKLPD